MAKGAVVAVFFSALVLLALTPQVEAQCKAIDTNSLAVCIASIRGNRCDAGCKSALQPYANQSPQCVCQLMQQAENLGRSVGVTKDGISRLIANCGQATPKCR